MKTEAIDFCKKYKQNLYNKEFLKKDNLSFLDKMDKNVVEFYITIRENYQASLILKLDKEDLEYLYKKYSKKAQEELEQNIQELKEKYKL